MADQDATASSPQPLANTYWVEPGRLLAGEYPGAMSRSDALARLAKLVRAGIDSFIDLTEEGEMPAYQPLLAAVAEGCAYRRLPLPDHRVPERRQHMQDVLAALASELAAGRRVYLHCRAGIGRTGMAMGCYLIGKGMSGREALDELQILWRQSARSEHWPSVPETDEQEQYVRDWGASPRPALLEAGDRAEGMLVALAATEILGQQFLADGASPAARVFAPVAAGPEAAMTRAVAESLLEHGGHQPSDQMQRYLEWSRSAPHGTVPADLRRALGTWQWSRKPNAGSHDPTNLDPHSLARTASVAIFSRETPTAALELAAEVSRTSQQSPLILEACRGWVAVLIDCLNGVSRVELASGAGPVTQVFLAHAQRTQVAELFHGRAPARAGADALSVLAGVLDAFASTATFRDGALKAMATARAHSSVGALYGALAGGHYGAGAIPGEWRRRVIDDAAFAALARQLAG